MSGSSQHKTHDDVAVRLRRAEGHLKKIITMIADGRGCLDIAQQLQAVESAVCNAKKILIHDHIDNCLDEAVGSVSKEGRSMVAEFKEITKYL
ncbi:MAG: metal-sensing transcriptional repressor [Rhodospirillales bacterium]|nr:metal-sensing transcriptional repressor [Rhodospirillales bacterium]